MSTTVTINVAASGDDGNVTNDAFSGGYPPPGPPVVNDAGTTMTARRSFTFGGYQIDEAFIKFSLATVPKGSMIISASLNIRVNSVTSTDGRNLLADYVDTGTFWPISTGDWIQDPPAGAFQLSRVSSVTPAAVNSFSLPDLSGITNNEGGSVGFRLHVDGGQPTGPNIVQMATFDNTSGFAIPQLVVTYERLLPQPVVLSQAVKRAAYY